MFLGGRFKRGVGTVPPSFKTGCLRAFRIDGKNGRYRGCRLNSDFDTWWLDRDREKCSFTSKAARLSKLFSFAPPSPPPSVNYPCMPVVPLSVRPFPCTTDLPPRTVQRPCFTPPTLLHVYPCIPMYTPPTLLHTRFPVRAPLPQPCTAPASVYIPPPPPPTLSLSDLHHHHAPSTAPTDCWGCPCSPRWHWRPPWPPWRPPRRAPWRASRGTSCRAP